jgi:hypothetical protein
MLQPSTAESIPQSFERRFLYGLGGLLVVNCKSDRLRLNRDSSAEHYGPRTPDQSAIADIDDKLAMAHNQYVARQYWNAIQSYQDAQALIYAQLDAGFLGNLTSITQFRPSARRHHLS